MTLRQDQVAQDLARRLIGNSVIPLLGSAGGSALMVAVHWSPERAPLLLAWLGLVYLALAVRIRLVVWFRRYIDSAEYEPRIMRRYALSTGLSGLAWGCGGLLVVGAGPLALVLTITAIQAMVMGGVVTLSTVMIAFLAFAIPAMLPMVATLAWVGGFTNMVMAVYSFIFLLLMIGVARSWNLSLRRAIELTLEKEDLIVELTEAHSKASAADQAKTQFLAVMSHEIRTPMNGVIGMTHLMLDQPLSDELRDQAETVHQSAESLLVILDDILDFSKLEAGKLTIQPQSVDLRQLVLGVVELMRPRAEEKGLRLDVAVDEILPAYIELDPLRLRQILLNLLGNAIKFTETGFVEVRALARDQRLRLSVQDSGIGIPAEAEATLFDEFTQVDDTIARRFGGTGLGLAICRRLAVLMGGGIALDSSGPGSVFTVDLPLVASVAPTVLPEQELPRLSPLTILLAEDNRVNQKVAVGLLSKYGHKVTVVGDGAQAVAAVRDGHFDAVLMDMQMPTMDGLEATRTIRALDGPLSRIPIIAMTANALKGDSERCLAAGMDGYVAKPVNLRALLSQLAEHVPSR